MSKSAPVTPSKVFQKPDLFKPWLKVSFNETVSLRFIDKPAYPKEPYPWEVFGKAEPSKENSEFAVESEAFASPKSAPFSLLQSSAAINSDYDDQKGRSEDEESVLDSNPESEEEFDESDEEYYEGDEGEYGSDEGDSYYSDSEYSESELEPEEEYQEPKRFKVTKSPSPVLPDTPVTEDYLNWFAKGVPSDQSEAAAESASDDQNGFTVFGKRSRDQFEKSKHEQKIPLQLSYAASYISPLSPEQKSTIVTTFNANRAKLEYYSEDSDYEEEQEQFELPPEPQSTGALHSSSSSASCSPSDLDGLLSPESFVSPLPRAIEETQESSRYFNDGLSFEERVAQRESGTAPRGEWEEEDDLCLHFSKAAINPNAVRPEAVERGGEIAQFDSELQ